MKNLLIVIALVAIGLYIQNHADFEKFKADCITQFKKTKTINTVNSTREKTQNDVYSITGTGR